MKRAISLITCLAILPFLTGAAFPFSFWKAPTAGGPTPAFGAQMGTFGDVGSETTDTLICSGSGCSIGSRITLFIAIKADALTASGVADSAGNTYTALASTAGVGTGAVSGQITRIYAYTANASTALTTSSTITVTWSTGTSHAVTMWAMYATNCNTSSNPDATMTLTASGSSTTAVSASCSAVSANTIGFAVVNEVSNDTLGSVGSGTWTALSSSPIFDNQKTWVYYQVFSGSGSKTISGTLSSAAWNVTGIVLYK